MSFEGLRGSRFRAAIAVACLAYLAIEAGYVFRVPLAMDEFQGAFTVHHLGEGLPYRDFQPYKPVLGYYAQLPFLMGASGVWSGLVQVKLGMAALTAITLAFVALRLGRRFDPIAVLLALALLVCMSTFLERSASLRVDMMTGLCGLLSLLFLLEARFARAGLLAGLAFLVSQKGIYFFMAGVGAIGLHAVLARRSRETLLRVLRFVTPAVGVWLVYFTFWSVLSSVDAVWTATVGAHREVALARTYSIHHYWVQTAVRNPYFWGVALLAIGALSARRSSAPEGDRDWHLWIYGAVLLGLGFWHRQPWPYFFVMLIPTAFVLSVAFFDLEVSRARSEGRGLGRTLLAIYLAIGVLYPLTRVPLALSRDNGFQRNTVELANALLGEHDRYLAGVNLLYTGRQTPRELSWLDGRRLARLGRLGPEEIAALEARLGSDPPRLVIDNYRLRRLPAPLRGVLATRYVPLWGNISVYAPAVAPEKDRFGVRFPGEYRLETRAGARVEVDGAPVSPGAILRLAAGDHTNRSEAPFRLVPRIELPASLREPGYRESRPLFPEVYGF